MPKFIRGVQQMPERDKFRLRIHILSFFTGAGRDMQEFDADPQTQVFLAEYDRQQVHDLVYDLVDAGLLFMRGATSGAVYRTTKAGRLVLPVFEDELKKDPR
jgi:hypothetical protein